MRRSATLVSIALLASGFVAFGQGQGTPQQIPQPAQSTTAKPHGRSPGGDIGSGTGDIGKGAGKGAGNLAKGTGKGAVDLGTLHPINAAGDIGKGGASAGKNVAVGAGKGTGKIAKGTGRAVKKIF